MQNDLVSMEDAMVKLGVWVNEWNGYKMELQDWNNGGCESLKVGELEYLKMRMHNEEMKKKILLY